MCLASQNADGSYSNKKRRLETPSRTPSAQHWLWAKRHEVARQASMAPYPVSSYKKLASHKATPAQSVQSPCENMQPQVPNNGLQGRIRSSETILPMSSSQQNPVSTPRNRAQHNQVNHIPPYLSIASQKARAQSCNRVLPTDTTGNTPGLFQNMSPSQLQRKVKAANRALQSTEPAQMLNPQCNNGSPTITAPPNKNNVPQHINQGQSQDYQQLLLAASAVQHQHQQEFANSTATQQSYQGSQNAFDLRKDSPSIQQGTRFPSLQNHSQRQQQHFDHSMWPQQLPVHHLPSSGVDENRLLSGQKNARTIFESVQASFPFGKNQQVSNVTVPPVLQPPYGTSGLAVSQFHPSHVSPTTAQAALAQIRNISQQHAAPINASNEFVYTQRCDTAQQEIARVHALQSHRARLQEAFGSQDFSGIPPHHGSSMQQPNSAHRPSGANVRVSVNNVYDSNHLTHCFTKETEERYSKQ